MAYLTSKGERLFNHLHPHPLVLTESPTLFGHCEVCGKTFLESVPYYTCTDCFASFHERCVELPQKISHPRHSQHHLTIHPKPPHIICYCYFCGEYWTYFTYSCSLCEFYICICCAFEECTTIKHASHNHDLTLLERPSVFRCDACGKTGIQEEDKSYLCMKCHFWIHYTCASSPVTLEYRDHHHPLTLAYDLPRTFSKFKSVCNICNEKVKAPHWFYSCEHCRYFVHLKCATSLPTPRDTIVATEEELGANLNLMSLPTANPLDVINHFVEEICLADEKATTPTTMLNHFGHNHLLQFCKELNNETESDKRMLCKVCVLPISAPYYNCAECNFSIHKCCAEIPREVTLKQGCYGNHTLFRSNQLDVFGFSDCDACRKPFNGLSFNCLCGCDTSFDVKCAALLNTHLKHEAHKHPLFPIKGSFLHSTKLCSACGKGNDHYSIGCDWCRFRIHMECAMLPPTVKHRWDKHPLVLMYPPYIFHREEFYCEYCEEEINPKLWIYHCTCCDQSFHLTCLGEAIVFSNTKHEVPFRVLQHSHPLTYVQRNRFECVCNICCDNVHELYNIDKLFECQTCNFRICIKCIQDPLCRFE